ncbi:hypothetical protein K6119_04910 [Paracrocinitomix mangrovi]|uniref:hypothetical protein n=1 Tax=Paracrocinitomix mangrovi TaxID=2862509 RepID=UPI001EDA2D87|nr:hypothetical protein [Paracrocinitomix mangrovi]UKN02854.1 hypothetical protein K6119_04910 [Paracrocinitomix mangrovi]
MLKSIFADSLNGFTPKYIPLFLFQLLVAGLLGLLLQKVLNRKFETIVIKNGTLMAIGIALIVAISKNSLPFSVLAAAVILLLALGEKRNQLQTIGLFLVALTGVGCGVGSVIQTLIGFALIVLVIMFLPLKDDVEKS